VIRWLKVLDIGLLLGAAFALWVAGPLMPSGMPLADRAFVWASVMGGPIVGTGPGMAVLHVPFGLGWVGVLLMPAHALWPNAAGGCVTVCGLVLWFLAGFLGMMAAVWGA
jgi:hypothetical protein